MKALALIIRLAVIALLLGAAYLLMSFALYAAGTIPH
jgi:hypothetical protein